MSISGPASSRNSVIIVHKRGEKLLILYGGTVPVVAKSTGAVAPMLPLPMRCINQETPYLSGHFLKVPGSTVRAIHSLLFYL